MIGWAETLYRLNREALHLFIDEADAWAPQRTVGNLAPRLLGAMEDLVRRGRARGLGITMITQRSASINKDLLTQIEVMIAKRTIAPQDRDAIEAWVKVHGTPERQKVMMDSLASLPKTRAWFWSPSWPDGVSNGLFQCVTIRKLETLDSSATPEVGAKRIAPKKLAAVDLQKLGERMAETIERAKAEDPRELRRKVAELQKQLAAKTGPTVLKIAANMSRESMERSTRIPAVGQAILSPAKSTELSAERLKREFDCGANSVKRELAGELAKYERESQKIHARVHLVIRTAHANALDLTDALDQELKRFDELAESKPRVPSLDSIIDQIKAAPVGQAVLPAAGSQPAPAPLVRPSSIPTRVHQHSEARQDGALPRGERSILTAIVQHMPDGCSREQLSIIAGYKRSSRDTYLQRLRERGFIAEGSSGMILATAEGIAALGPDFEPLPTGDALREFWLAKLPKGERAILSVLAGIYPEAAGRREIDEATGYQRSSRDTYLQRLSARLLIVIGSHGVRAAQELFG